MTTKYQPTSCVAESPVSPPTEEEMQALWFEQWFPPVLKTDEGDEVEVIQSGNWNHGAGPDFFQAAVRRAGGKVAVGTVELHLRASDWDAHGHHVDPEYNETILHVCWERPAKTFFPATQDFRHVPQVILKDQLVASWELLKPHLGPVLARDLPRARAGRCQEELAHQPAEKVLEIVREAGHYRLRQKAERIGWRIKAVGRRQALWEALAEGLGYSQNKIPMRLLAQRLPHARLQRWPRGKRFALLFGLSGLLPATNLAAFAPGVREWIKPQWGHWWKARSVYDYAILPRASWKLAALRPWNRPERRVAALAALVPLIRALEQSIVSQRENAFAEILEAVSDPFWDLHTTFIAGPLPKRHHLIGAERIGDLVTNVFWPFVCLANDNAAESGWRKSQSRPNRVTTLASQRLFGQAETGLKLDDTLAQQGLIQIYRDYCAVDASDCAQCKFPELIRQWE